MVPDLSGTGSSEVWLALWVNRRVSDIRTSQENRVMDSQKAHWAFSSCQLVCRALGQLHFAETPGST